MSKKICYYLILLINFAMTNAVMALEQNKTQDFKTGLVHEIQRLGQQQDTKSAQNSANEAIRVANQYQSISNNIKTQSGSLMNSNTQSFFNISVFSRLKSIVSQIQILSQDLVNLVMPGPQYHDSVKVDETIKKLDEQQKALSNLIQSQPNSSTQQGPSMQPTPPPDQPTFDPSAYDRPKQTGFQVYK